MYTTHEYMSLGLKEIQKAEACGNTTHITETNILKLEKRNTVVHDSSLEMDQSVQSPDEVPLLTEKAISKTEEISKTEKLSAVMEATTTQPSLSSFGEAACCHQGLAR